LFNNAVSNLVGAAPASLDTLQELATALGNNANFSTTVLNSVANVGVTATTALNNTTSILATISTLPTYTYVNSNKQPIDTTGTLAALPSNLTTNGAYFGGFPGDQLTWIGIGSASSNNSYSASTGNYQLLTFPSTSSTLTFTSSNNKPLQACTFGVSIMLGSATSFILSVTNGGITYGSAVYDQNLSTTQYTNVTLSFTAPADTVNSLNFNIGGRAGTVYARNWYALAGTGINTQLRGNLNVPYGNVSSSDFLYGLSKTSVANSLTTVTNSIANVGTTATIALNNTTSILATIPTLATAASVTAITPTSRFGKCY